VDNVILEWFKGEREMSFELVICPYCDSNDWDQIGLTKGQGKENIQAECNDCKGVFEMVVSERIEYPEYSKEREFRRLVIRFMRMS